MSLHESRQATRAASVDWSPFAGFAIAPRPLACGAFRCTRCAEGQHSTSTPVGNFNSVPQRRSAY